MDVLVQCITMIHRQTCYICFQRAAALCGIESPTALGSVAPARRKPVAWLPAARLCLCVLLLAFCCEEAGHASVALGVCTCHQLAHARLLHCLQVRSSTPCLPTHSSSSTADPTRVPTEGSSRERKEPGLTTVGRRLVLLGSGAPGEPLASCTSSVLTCRSQGRSGVVAAVNALWTPAQGYQTAAALAW